MAGWEGRPWPCANWQTRCLGAAQRLLGNDLVSLQPPCQGEEVGNLAVHPWVPPVIEVPPDIPVVPAGSKLVLVYHDGQWSWAIVPPAPVPVPTPQ